VLATVRPTNPIGVSFGAPRIGNIPSDDDVHYNASQLNAHPVEIAPMSEDVRRMVGRNVRQLRIAAGLSQAELAERMGVDRAYVSGLELGQRNPTILTLWHLAVALGVKLKPLFEEKVSVRRRSR
jgi:ribosome-binding protein aMBF1 (putative translation factor)